METTVLTGNLQNFLHYRYGKYHDTDRYKTPNSHKLYVAQYNALRNLRFSLHWKSANSPFCQSFLYKQSIRVKWASIWIDKGFAS
jgi:hypothetical protein